MITTLRKKIALFACTLSIFYPLICTSALTSYSGTESYNAVPYLTTLQHATEHSCFFYPYFVLTNLHACSHVSQTVQQELSFLKQIRWTGMVIDEAHRLKNSVTQVRSSLKDLDVDFTVLLTGTVLFTRCCLWLTALINLDLQSISFNFILHDDDSVF